MFVPVTVVISSKIANGFGPIPQGTCTNKLGSLELAIEACKKAETGGVGNLTQVFEKASKDLQNFQTGIEKLVSLEPAKITQDFVDEAKQILLCCKQRKEGLQKTLNKAKVLLE